jgi:hypothetical protein
VALEVGALEKKKEKRIEEILEDPGGLFNWALEVLREEYPEDFEDPYLVEQYVNSLAYWINELQLDIKLLDIFKNQGFNFKDCVKACIQLSGKSRSECSDHCRIVKAVLLEGRFDEPPI